MTIKNLIDTVKFDFNAKNIDYTQKNYSKDNGDAFSNVFESANKSYKFSLNKTEKFSSKNLNQNKENKNASSKKFKSDYENFNTKIDANKNINHSIKKEKETVFDSKNAVSEVKEDKKETVNDEKKAVSEVKEDKKETVNDEKKAVSEVKEDEKEIISDVKNNNLNSLNISAQINLQNANISLVQPQTVLQNTDEANAALQKNNTPTQLQAQIPEKILTQELSALQKQIANEKITDKQVGNILQQQSAEVEEETLEEIKATPEKTEAKTAEQLIKQPASQKSEVLVSQDILNKLNTFDKNQIKQPQGENSKLISEKTAEIINNEKIKPVITNVEFQNNSKSNSEGQNQKQTQQEFKLNINQTQFLSSDNNSLSKTDLQKTSGFDKILDAKQSQTLENSVLNQLKDKISSDTAINKSQINIALRPDNLGKVNINLVSQNGVLTAQITAENKQIKDILTKGLEILRQNMAEQGINVGKMVVNVQEPAASNQNMNFENNQKNFEQANSNLSNMNSESNKQNHSEKSDSANLNNDFYEFDEESESEMNESNALAGQSSIFQAGRVDYKV